MLRIHRNLKWTPVRAVFEVFRYFGVWHDYLWGLLGRNARHGPVLRIRALMQHWADWTRALIFTTRIPKFSGGMDFWINDAPHSRRLLQADLPHQRRCEEIVKSEGDILCKRIQIVPASTMDWLEPRFLAGNCENSIFVNHANDCSILIMRIDCQVLA